MLAALGFAVETDEVVAQSLGAVEALRNGLIPPTSAGRGAALRAGAGAAGQGILVWRLVRRARC